VVLCTGAWPGGLVREPAGPGLPVRRVRLQMTQTDPLGEPLTTSVADADSCRYYPAYGYAQRTEPGRVVHRQQVREGVWLVTGPGGRGMTCAPATAETTANELGW
jgi:glycine/D-amino acid oxidase-like deaminating enzyme